MIQFEHPFMLLLCFCVGPAVVLTVLRLKRIKKAYSSAAELPFVMRSASIRLAAWAMAWLFLCAAAAVPLWGTRKQAVFRQGNSVVFAVDISRSMTVTDMPPTRLDFAKRYLEFMIAQLENTACALVTVKGRGILSVPLTFEHRSLNTALQRLSPQTATDTGTNLEQGIQTALDAFPKKRLEGKVIVLCTDGDETAGSLMQLIPRLKEEQALLIIVGFGTGEGAALSILNEKGEKAIRQVPLVKDPLESVIKQLDNGSMYIHASESGSVWKILNAIKNTAQDSENMQYVEKPVRRVFECTLLALLFFSAGILSGLCRFNKHILMTSAVLLLFVSCTPKQRMQITHVRGVLAAHRGDSNKAIVQFSSAEAQAQKMGDAQLAGYASFSLASVYLLQNEAEAASHKLSEIPENADIRLRALQWYQQGMIAFGRKDYAEAADCFKQSLMLYGADIDAKKNYELCRRLCVVQEETAQKPVNAEAQADTNPQDEAVLQIIQKKEDTKWKNTPQEEKPAINDY